MTCHAGSLHGHAADRGPYGALCPSCWARVGAIVERMLGRAMQRAGP